jgi:ABC-type lipoprotein release transport system permease subunit
MMFWLRFALRSCLRRRRRTGIILAGVAFAVGALVVLGAIMVGVNDTMIANAAALGSGQVAIAGHGVPMTVATARAEELQTAAALLPGVRDALPRCNFPALLKSENATHAVQVRLVQPDVEARRTPVAKRMVAGAYFAGGDGFVIGDTAAAALKCIVGDTVTLVTSAARYERQVTGIYHTGIDEYDGGLAFVPIAAAKEFNEPQVE